MALPDALKPLLVVGLLCGPLPLGPVTAQPAPAETTAAAPSSAAPAVSPFPRPGSREFMRALNRAKTLARQEAVRANGGSNRYRAEDRMYGPAMQAPYSYSDGYFTFRFLGGAPGWQLLGQRPQRETIVSVSYTGDKVEIDYNGRPQQLP